MILYIAIIVIFMVLPGFSSSNRRPLMIFSRSLEYDILPRKYGKHDKCMCTYMYIHSETHTHTHTHTHTLTHSLSHTYTFVSVTLFDREVNKLQLKRHTISCNKRSFIHIMSTYLIRRRSAANKNSFVSSGVVTRTGGSAI